MTIKSKQWPFEGDSFVVRSRKVALAYRQTALDYETALNELLEIVANVDERVVGWINDERFEMLYKMAKEGTGRPILVAQHDERFYQWGETWHASFVPHYDEDEWINTRETADLLCLHTKTVTELIQRGRLEGKQLKLPGDHHKRWYVRAGQVFALQRERRTRNSPNRDSTDTMPSSGSSDAT